ncbi:MAG: hypothetical protein LBT13_10725 [Treponema sp.]|jgi:hypothetical protein|nr:hypothetical protein [Treponema sp.]
MRKLVLILIAFIAVVTFIRAFDTKGAKIVDVPAGGSIKNSGSPDQGNEDIFNTKN